MKLAFSGQARYTDFVPGYELYLKRTKGDTPLERAEYNRIVRRYCSLLADRLIREGMIDLPCDMGSIVAAKILRKPQYRGKKFIGYGKMDWSKGHYDGSLRAFGLVFLPRRDRHRNANLRCYGFVANRQLFKNMKSRYESDDCPWTPVEFNDDMI